MEREILAGLVQRGIPLHIAQGIVANMIAESRLDPGINEAAPIVPGSRGGYGLNQWTGPRRRALETAAQERGVPVNDLNFQLDYTLEELQGPERSAWAALQGARDATEAARIYSERFLRPGIPHMDRRLSEAARLAGVAPGNALAGQPPRNALAGVQGQPDQPGAYQPPRPQLGMLDPRAFMTASAAPNLLRFT